ncbi:MAG: MarR family winged helix-turn-helix transcriptional regulator [Solirubrobacterales bacterium]
MRAGHDLSLNEYEVLLQLWLAEGRRLRRVDLAGSLLLSQGGITRLLAGLERRSLVDRIPCPEDGRVAYAHLTAAGAACLEAARDDHLADVERLFADRFSAGELESLGDLLSRLRSEGRADTGAGRAATQSSKSA